MELAPIWNTFEWWEIFIGGISTFAIFSFLYKENPVYRFFEHFYIGIATAYGIMVTVREFLWPKVLLPLLGLDRPVFPDGTYGEPYNTNYLVSRANGVWLFVLFHSEQTMELVSSTCHWV